MSRTTKIVFFVIVFFLIFGYPTLVLPQTILPTEQNNQEQIIQRLRGTPGNRIGGATRGVTKPQEEPKQESIQPNQHK